MPISQLNFIHNDAGLFMMSIYVPSGSIYEHVGHFKSKQISGISHFIEHLLYKHTENYTGKEVLQNFTKLGGFYNASTDKDQTTFYVKTLVENYTLATDLLYEVVLRPRFKPSEVGTERKVVLEEYSQTQDDYDDILYQGSNKSILDTQNIYLPPVIGNKKHLLKVDYSTLWKYYRERFQNFLIVVNCDVNHHKQVKEYIVKKVFAGKQERILPVNFHLTEFESLSRQFVHKVLVEQQNTAQYNTCLSFTAYEFRDYKSNLVLDFVKFCLTDAGLYSVLSYAIREQRGLVYSIKASNEKMRYIGLFKIFFGTSNKDVANILTVIINILNEVKAKGFDRTILQFYKTSYLNHMKYRFTNEETRASWHGDNLFYGVQLTENEYIAQIEKISNQDIKNICAHVFNIQKMSVYTFGNYHNKKELQKKLQHTFLSSSQHV